MTRRPLLVTSAATAALALCVASGTASAATTNTAAAGRGTSTLSLLNLTVAGHDLSLGNLVLASDTITSPKVSSISVTPVTVDGTAYGTQTVNQSSSPKTVAPVSAPGALAPFANLTSPAFDLTASSLPSNHAGASSLGSVKVLGLPVALSGAVGAATSVTNADGARGLKTVSITNLALPSINDILGALGLDLSALPVGTLDELVNALELVTGAVATAEGAVDTAQAAVDSATTDLAAKSAALTSAQGTLTTAQATLATATTALNALITANSAGLTPLGITDITTLFAASPVNLTAAQSLVPTLAAAMSTYTSAGTAVTAAQTAVATAQGLVNTAQALLTTLTATLTGAINTLVGAITGLLDSTPLVSLDSLVVKTRAAVTSASKGGQAAEVVGGAVTGLKVLGVDVLDAALGSSTLDLTGVATSALSEVNGLMDEVTGTLSEVLSSVPGLPALNIPAPNVSLLTKSATTSISGGFGRANTVVQGLTISLPAITVPSAVAVPNAANLPALSGVTQVAGQLTSAPVSMGVLTLHDQASFRPAAIATGSTGTPGGHLADTGMPAGVAALSMLLVGLGLVLRRRMVAVA